MAHKVNRSSSQAALGEDQVDEFKDVFEMFDLERKGQITKDVLKQVLNQFGEYA
jgi:Ca2+-binding EF-hand superfamily protein